MFVCFSSASGNHFNCSSFQRLLASLFRHLPPDLPQRPPVYEQLPAEGLGQHLPPNLCHNHHRLGIQCYYTKNIWTPCRFTICQVRNRGWNSMRGHRNLVLRYIPWKRSHQVLEEARKSSSRPFSLEHNISCNPVSMLTIQVFTVSRVTLLQSHPRGLLLQWGLLI